MDYFLASPVEPSPISEASLSSSYRTEAGAALGFSFMPYFQHAPYLASTAVQDGFPDSQFYPTEPSIAVESSISEASLSSSYRTEAGAALGLSSMPYVQHAPYFASTAVQGGFPDFQFHPTEPSVAVARRSSSFLSTALIPPMSCPTRNDALSGDVDHSVSSLVPVRSEFSAYGARQASGDSAVVAGAQPIAPHEDERKINGVIPSATAAAVAGGQASPHPKHVVSWYLTCWQAVIVNGPRKFVPQTIYEPHSQGDKERYVSLAKLRPPIIFLSQDSPEWGILVSQLLSKQPPPLVEGDEPAFASCGPSMSIRVQWPGYQPCHKQVSTRDYTSKRSTINKAKLAQVVARCVKQFMDDMSEQAMQLGSDRRWRIGPLDIKVDDIILVSLHHVSQGSWQPQLRLRRVNRSDVSGGPQGHRGSQCGGKW